MIYYIKCVTDNKYYVFRGQIRGLSYSFKEKLNEV